MSEKLTVKTAKLPMGKVTSFKNSVLVFFCAKDQPLSGEGAAYFAKTGLDWDILTKAADYSGKTAEVLSILAPPNLGARRLLIVGVGQIAEENAEENADEGTATAADWAGLGGKLLTILQNTRTSKASIILDATQFTPEAVAQITAGLHLRHYGFEKYKSKADDDKPKPKSLAISLHVENKSAADKAIHSRYATVQGTLLARDLQNEPPNVLGPVEFAKVAQSLSAHGVDVEILTHTQMKKLGMGSLLAVAQGSSRPARMAVMVWNGGKKSDKPIAFVGKGVVFDTGGISIKPAGGMQDMKGDMGGAAAVTGLMKALALRKAKVNVVGVIGLAENMPDGNAYRPGDIVTAMSGTTIEVINTDAEGRLVLADALWYTQDRFKPKAMINLATLTGAIMVALGQDYAGLFSNNDELASRLHEAGNITGEKLWRMPLSAAYDKQIKSRFADIKNTGGRYGGAITAAQFLQRFVNDVPWAHLDIAGTGFGTPASDINKSWASGFGVAVLDQLIREHYEN